ncbi:MFS transporter [Nonomuraea sp. NPDC050328]|uniref:MFS transporter n=1 Tax=Nonomuraea sp. NPDC050328 TaxID=3364361 RepID=UPI0037B8ED49
MKQVQGAAPPTAVTPGFRLGPLYVTLPVANAAVFFLWLTVGAFVLPAHVQRITGENNVAALGLANTIGPLLATIANPVFGQISDRTRSRFGRRSPWILGCVALGIIALAVQASASTVLMLGLSWAAVQAIMNGYQAAVTAILPDRVPERRYGTFSGLVGLGVPLATVVTSIVFIAYPELAQGGAYYIVMVVLAAAALLIVFGSPDKDSRDLPPQPLNLAQFFAGFVRPLKSRDFAWAFLSRFGVMAGYMIIFTFNFFLLEEFIGIPKGEVVQKMGILMLIGQVSTIAAVVIVGPLSDRVNRFRLFALIAGIASAVSLVIPLLMPTFEGMIIYNVVHGIAFGIYGAVDMALVTKVLPNAHEVGKDLGVINIANAGPQILAPAIAAFVVLNLGGYASLFIVGIVISLIASFGVMKIKGVR